MALLPQFATGQYYDLGRSPSSIHWNQTSTSWGRIIYPDYYTKGAASLYHYINEMAPSINYGLDYGPLKRIPMLLHTQNFRANGLVMRAPRRIELEVIPNINTYAEPWLKQLAVHEFRHAVQYGNLYRGFMKYVGYVIGEQAGLASLALVPTWLLEGDAVMTETQMSSFGRALQPSFTIEYRAYFTENEKKYPLDKWFCGSFRTQIPDHYQFGYQLTAWAREKYGDDVWAKVFDYSAKYPFTILTTKWALHKYYKTKVNRIADSTIDNLTRFWKSLPEQTDNSSIIPTKTTSYTVYDAPMVVNDSIVVVFKKDMDKPNALVEVNTKTAEEKVLTYTGSISTPGSLRDGVVYWTEYRNSTFWDQRVFSRACSYNLLTGEKNTLRDRQNVLYVTPLPDGEIVSVGYDYKTARYSLEFGETREAIMMPDTISVHGLAYDDVTGTLAFIGLGDAGMFIGNVDIDNGSIEKITEPSKVTINNLRAGNAKLSFNSIYSGRDEIHIYDLITDREYQLTTSRYGSVSPSAPNKNADWYMTTYTRDGYKLAKIDKNTVIEDSLPKVSYSYIPKNVVNPPRRKWNVATMDTVATVTELPEGKRVRRFRKGLNLFNTHSWMPLAFNPFQIIAENKANVNVGVTIMSQNLLSDMFGYLSFASTDQGNNLRGMLSYYGWAPKFDLNFSYGGGNQIIYGKEPQMPVPSKIKKYFHIDLKTSLPMTLSSGYHTRTLVPSISVMHTNALLYESKTKTFDRGYQRTVSALTYTDNVRLATRDILPKWGYALKMAMVNAPFDKDFGNLVSLYGRVYLPGILPHNSIMLRGNVQYQDKDKYNFTYKELTPRGSEYEFAVTKYAAASIDYQLPIWYPDWGINSIAYFKRVRFNAYFDFARMERYISSTLPIKKMQNITSYGGELFLDMHVLRIPVNMATLGFYLYKPSDRKGVVTGFTVGLPL